MSIRSEERVAYLEGQVSELSLRLSAIERKVDHLEQRMDTRFEAVDRRFDTLEAKMSTQFMWLIGIQVTTLVAIVAALISRG